MCICGTAKTRMIWPMASCWGARVGVNSGLLRVPARASGLGGLAHRCAAVEQATGGAPPAWLGGIANGLS